MIQALVWCTSLLPLSVARWWGKTLATLVVRLDTESVRITRLNIDECFKHLSEEERRRLVRSSLQHTAMLLMEAGMLWFWSLERCRRLWDPVEGEEHVENALNQKKGILLLVPHYGNWEVLSLYLGKWGYTCLYDPPRIKEIEKAMVAARSRTGGNLVPIGPPAIRAMIKALRQGGIVVLLPDQVPEPGAGVYAPFYGRPAFTMTLAQRLLRLTGATPLAGIAERAENGFAIRFERAPDDLAAEDAVRATTALNQMTEQLISRDPAQYQWEYRRFKRPPPGVNPLYQRRQ